MKKIVYILDFPSTRQMEKYLFIRELIGAGFVVEYWDLSQIYFKDFPFQHVLSHSYIRKISSWSSFKSCLRKEKFDETMFVVQVNFEWRTVSLYFLLMWFKCKTTFFCLLPQPSNDSLTSLMDKIRSALFSKKALSKSLNLFSRICRKAGLTKGYDLVFTVGESEGDLGRKPSQVVHINYHDYDEYQLSKCRTERIVEGDYCVFIDEGSIFNEDVKILRMGHLDQEVFFTKLNRFFSLIEAQFGLKVVIAAHPGITYDRSIFGGRQVYEGKTCDLIKDCVFVISQSSLAASFAVLFRKPIIFIYTEEYALQRKRSFDFIKGSARLLGLRPVKIDDVSEIKEMVGKIDPKCYDDYKYTYLTSKASEHSSTKDIIINTLRNFSYAG